MNNFDLGFDDVCDVDREAREILAEIRELEGDRYE